MKMPLRHLATVIAGQAPASEKVRDLEDGLPFIQGNAEFGHKHPKPRYECSTPSKTCVAGDILLSVRAPVGELNVADRAYAIGRGLAAIRPYMHIDARFLRYALFANLDRLHAAATGTTFLAVTLGDLKEIRLPAPPLEVQSRIADFLDDQVALLHHLERCLAQSVDLWSEQTESSIDAMLTSGRGMPSTWPRLSYLVRQITSGPRGWADFTGESGSPFFRSANLRRDSLSPRLDDLVRVQPPPSALAESARTSVDLGDVLVGITGANSGWVSLVREPELVGGHVSQHVALIRADRSMIRSAWLAHSLRSRTCSAQLSASEYGGTKTQLSLPDLRALRVPVSTLEHQDQALAQIQVTVQTFERLRDLRLRQIELVSERKKALITAAVTGEFDVTTARSVA
jgi:type I restriction enzyme S subunit